MVGLTFRIAGTLLILSPLGIGWAVLEGWVLVAHILKVHDLIVAEEHACSQTVHRSIAPAFVEEATGTVEIVKVGTVGFAPKKFKTGNLEV